MEIFNNLPGELRREVMSYTHEMCDATKSQLWVFKRLPPNLQEMVLSGKYPREFRDHSFKKCSNFLGRHCPLRFSFYGYFPPSRIHRGGRSLPQAWNVLEVQAG